MTCRASLVVFLTLASAEVQPFAASGCDSSSPECETDNQLSISSHDELQGLDLLQIDMRLQPVKQQDAATPTPAANNPPSKLLQTKRQAGQQVEVRHVSDKSSAASTRESHATSSKTFLQRVYMSISVAAARVHAQLGNLGISTGLAIGFVALGIILSFIAIRDGQMQLPPPLGGVTSAKEGPSGSEKTDGLFSASQPRGNEAPETHCGNAQQLLPAPKTPMDAPSYVLAAQQKSSDGPPPICPALIMPHNEARFLIPIESLMRASGELDIKGTSGRKLLHGSVTETLEGRRCIAIASCGCEDEPRITLLAPPSKFAPGPLTGASTCSIGTTEIFGEAGSFYGTLEPAPGGRAVLRCNGHIVMSLDAVGEDLRMTALSMDGCLLASAGKTVQVGAHRVESHDAWKLQVKPGYDAILIVACMMSVMLFSQ